MFFSFGSLAAGVTSALDSAGLLEQVTVYGQDFSAFALEEIVAGTMGAWSADPKAYAGWLMVDAAARLSLGMELTEERDAASLPTVIVEDADVRPGDPRLLQRRLVPADHGGGLQGALGRPEISRPMSRAASWCCPVGDLTGRAVPFLGAKMDQVSES